MDDVRNLEEKKQEFQSFQDKDKALSDSPIKQAKEARLEDYPKRKKLKVVFRTPNRVADRPIDTELSDSELNTYNELYDNRIFNKGIMLNNIRTIIKENDNIKIGQIEKEAGVSLGYTSRLEKPDNTADPSMGYILTASKMLNVSLDTLLQVDLSQMSPTEKYIVDFLDKLKTNTVQLKLNWKLHSADELNSITDNNVFGSFPLFSNETFYMPTETDYPEQVTKNVMVSKAYGPLTYISGDCYSLKLKNKSLLCLMDIEKAVHNANDASAYCKEIWMVLPDKKKKYIAGTKDSKELKFLIEFLFEAIKEYEKHPLLDQDCIDIIDAFMQDDFQGV